MEANDVISYKKLADAIPVKVWMTEADGSCVYLNKAWYEFTGIEKKNNYNDDRSEAIHPDDREQVFKILDDANKYHFPFSVTYRLKNVTSEYHWHRDSGEPRFDQDGTFLGFTGALTDIQEQKSAEEFMHQSESWYKNYAEAMPQMAFVADPQGNIIYYNERWYEYVSGLEGTEGWGWRDKQVHHPDDLQRTIDRWNYSLKTGEPYEIQYRLKRYDGKYRWHLGRAIPFRDEDGKIQYWIGTNTDVHEQVMAHKELIKANDALKSKNIKLRRLRKLHNNLLYIIAHDLKGPLGNMKMAMELIESYSDVQKKEEMFGHLRRIVDQQGRTLDGLSEIIMAQTPEDLKYRKVDLQEIIADIISEFKTDLEEKQAKIEYDIHEVSNIIYVRGFVFSILRNLVSNAIKYSDDNRLLKIKIASKRKNDFVLIKVEDNGMGMDLKKYGNDLFKAFQRLTEKSEGSGIGLYIVKSLIEDNGGYIEVESQPGVGTTFYCYFKEY